MIKNVAYKISSLTVRISKFVTILRKNEFHSCRFQYHQSLTQRDFRNRIRFCRWAKGRTQNGPNCFCMVLFTGESSIFKTKK